ncbi:MAG: hypothetical protein IKO57_14025 [Treponema sp.]|nr:hypothetical protein [Treponema sp.]
MKKLLAILAMALMAFNFVACSDDEEENETDKASTDSTLFNESSDGLILATNNSDQDLVLFYDSVRAATLIGGLPANSTKHRMKLPDSGKLYVVHAVKYSDYKNATTSTVSGLKIIDSALVYSDPIEERSLSIGESKWSGDCEIRFHNQTGYYIEVGKGSANDEDIFHTMRPNSDESVFVDYDRNGYTLYMICNLPIRKNNKIIGVQRKFVEDWSDIIMPTTSTVAKVSIGKTAITEHSYYTDGYVRIVNNYSRGFSVNNGSTLLYSTLDHGALPSGADEVYQFAGSTEGRAYSQIKLTAAVESHNKTVPTFSVKNGYKYLMEIASDGTVTVNEIGAITEEEEEELIW